MTHPLLDNVIREKIKDSGLSINQLSKITNITVSQLHRFINKKQTLTLKTAQRLTDYFHLEFKTVLPDDEEK